MASEIYWRHILSREMSVLTSEDLGALTSKDLHEIFSIIHLANCHLRLPEMRTRIAKSLKQAFQAKGVVFLLADREFRTIDNTSLIGAGVDLHYMDPWVHYYCHHDPFQLEGRSKNTVCRVGDILPYRQWVNLPIYTEFYRPQNIHHKLSIYLRSNGKVLGLIGLFRRKSIRISPAGRRPRPASSLPISLPRWRTFFCSRRWMSQKVYWGNGEIGSRCSGL